MKMEVICIVGEYFIVMGHVHAQNVYIPVLATHGWPVFCGWSTSDVLSSTSDDPENIIC